MTKEKQIIEEMAITICRKRHACILKDGESCRKCYQHERCLYQDIAYALYQEDYRKQSEVIDEFAKRLLDAFPEGNRDARCPAIYYDDYRYIIEELAEKMKRRCANDKRKAENIKG